MATKPKKAPVDPAERRRQAVARAEAVLTDTRHRNVIQTEHTKLIKERFDSPNTWPMRCKDVGVWEEWKKVEQEERGHDFELEGEEASEEKETGRAWVSLNVISGINFHRWKEGHRAAGQFVSRSNITFSRMKVDFTTLRRELTVLQEVCVAFQVLEESTDPERSLSKIEMDLVFEFWDCYEAGVSIALHHNCIHGADVQGIARLREEIFALQRSGNGIYERLRTSWNNDIDATIHSCTIFCKEAIAAGAEYLRQHIGRFPVWFKSLESKDRRLFWRYVERFIVLRQFELVVRDKEYPLLDSLNIDIIHDRSMVPKVTDDYKNKTFIGPPQPVLRSWDDLKQLSHSSIISRVAVASTSPKSPKYAHHIRPALSPYRLGPPLQNLRRRKDHAAWLEHFFLAQGPHVPELNRSSVPQIFYDNVEDASGNVQLDAAIRAELMRGARRLEKLKTDLLGRNVWDYLVLPAAKNADLQRVKSLVEDLIVMAGGGSPADCVV